MTKFSDAGWSPDMHSMINMARMESRMLHEEMFGRDQTITSGMRPRTPGGSSLHPEGKAYDIRVREPDGSWAMSHDEQREFARRLQDILGVEFDVIVEGPAAFHSRYFDRPPHIHVEYDPKGRHAQRLVEDSS